MQGNSVTRADAPDAAGAAAPPRPRDTIYAELNLSGTVQRVKLDKARMLSGYFRVEPTETGFTFYRNEQLVATLEGTFPVDLERRFLIGSHHDSPTMRIHYAAAGPYVSGGTYTTGVQDDLVSSGWGRILESSFVQLPGNSLMYETRAGEAATPDETWSAWQAVGEDDLIVSPEGRYIQFRVTFLTTDRNRTPGPFEFHYEIRPAA